MDEPLIIIKVYDLVLYLIPQIAKLPRQQRYTLGERIESMTLDFFKIHQSIQAWIGHVKHADTVRLRKFLLGDFVF